MLKSLYVDFNSYFASVEQHERPELRGKPIAIVPMMAESTSALAASYEAKRYGVKTGTRVADARTMCPGLILVQARHDVYVKWHHKLVDLIESVVHVRRVYSVDEMSCELIGSMRNEDRAVSIAYDVKRALLENVGESIKCSIGIAPNDYLAKTASDMQKPDGLVIIRESDLPHILFDLELRDLCGIGKKMYERLWRHGIYTVEALTSAPVQKLREVWGGIEGERMYARLRGVDITLPESDRSTVGHSHVLPPALRTREGATGVLHRLLQKAAARIRSYGLLAGRLSVSIRHRDGSRWKHRLTLTATHDTVTLTAALAQMLAAWPAEHTDPIKVSVTLDDVEPAGGQPQQLFEEQQPSRDRLNESLDAINKKYGRNALFLGSAWNALHTAATRIAFQHIPEHEDDGDES